MRLAPLTTAVTPPDLGTNPAFDKAVSYLDWAHEAAGTAMSVDAELMSAEDLMSASNDAASAAKLLTEVELSDAAKHAMAAATAFNAAATAKLHEDPDVATEVTMARGEDADTAIHDAFLAMGLPGRGE